MNFAGVNVSARIKPSHLICRLTVDKFKDQLAWRENWTRMANEEGTQSKHDRVVVVVFEDSINIPSLSKAFDKHQR